MIYRICFFLTPTSHFIQFLPILKEIVEQGHLLDLVVESRHYNNSNISSFFENFRDNIHVISCESDYEPSISHHYFSLSSFQIENVARSNKSGMWKLLGIFCEKTKEFYINNGIAPSLFVHDSVFGLTACLGHPGVLSPHGIPGIVWHPSSISGFYFEPHVMNPRLSLGIGGRSTSKLSELIKGYAEEMYRKWSLPFRPLNAAKKFIAFHGGDPGLWNHPFQHLLTMPVFYPGCSSLVDGIGTPGNCHCVGAPACIVNFPCVCEAHGRIKFPHLVHKTGPDISCIRLKNEDHLILNHKDGEDADDEEDDDNELLHSLENPLQKRKDEHTPSTDVEKIISEESESNALNSNESKKPPPLPNRPPTLKKHPSSQAGSRRRLAADEETSSSRSSIYPQIFPSFVQPSQSATHRATAFIKNSHAAGRPCLLVSFGSLITMPPHVLQNLVRGCCDPLSRFSAVIALKREQDRELAEEILYNVLSCPSSPLVTGRTTNIYPISAKPLDTEASAEKGNLTLVHTIGPLVVPFIDVNQVLLEAGLSAVLCHGGFNFVLESIAARKPLIIIPVFGDQNSNGRLIETTRLGITLDKREFLEDINGWRKLRKAVLSFLLPQSACASGLGFDADHPNYINNDNQDNIHTDVLNRNFTDDASLSLTHALLHSSPNIATDNNPNTNINENINNIKSYQINFDEEKNANNISTHPITSASPPPVNVNADATVSQSLLFDTNESLSYPLRTLEAPPPSPVPAPSPLLLSETSASVDGYLTSGGDVPPVASHFANRLLSTATLLGLETNVHRDAQKILLCCQMQSIFLQQVNRDDNQQPNQQPNQQEHQNLTGTYQPVRDVGTPLTPLTSPFSPNPPRRSRHLANRTSVRPFASSNSHRAIISPGSSCLLPSFTKPLLHSGLALDGLSRLYRSIGGKWLAAWMGAESNDVRIAILAVFGIFVGVIVWGVMHTLLLIVRLIGKGFGY